MKLRISIVPLLIVAILGVLALVSHTGGGISTKTIYASEAVYAIAITAADNYRHDCVGDPATGAKAFLPSSCRAVLVQIQDGVRVSDAAYQKIKGYETNPPNNWGEVFIADAALLKGVIPAVYYNTACALVPVTCIASK